MDRRNAVFIISVAARLVDLHPSTLRKYERCGLLDPPSRQSGRLRLYSPEDITRLRQIKTLVEERGVNLAGVERALAITERAQLLRDLATTETDPDRLRRHCHMLAEDMLRVLDATPRNASTDSGTSDANSCDDTAADTRRAT
jgi:MerR family transcriptional regulator, heat shock protein HspR